MSGKKNPHWGTTLDELLVEDGIREAAKAEALTRVLAWQLSQEMERQGLTEAALAAYDAEVAAIRSEGLSSALQTPDVERFYALGFALEQLCRDLADLAPRVQEFGGGGAQRA